MDWLKLKVFVLSEDENKWVHLEVILPYDENLQDQIAFYKKNYPVPVNKFVTTEPILGCDDWEPLPVSPEVKDYNRKNTRQIIPTLKPNLGKYC